MNVAMRVPRFLFPVRRVVFAAWVVGLCLATLRSAAGTGLDDYIAKPDASYSYNLVNTINGAGYTGYHVDLNSQTWRSPTEITNRTLWQHQMTITRPDVIQRDMAILLIEGGNSNGGFSDQADLALATGAVVIHLPTAPNQPLRFAGENFDRYEDEILSKTFANFLDGGDSEWPALLPMTKSAVRAMDTAQAIMASQGVTIDEFFVSGGSKRGWTTWLTAAVDDRVAGIGPRVIEVLNLDEQMANQREAYEGVTQQTTGGYADAVHDYVDQNIMDRLSTPRGQELLEIIDPYEYRDRLDMPKYLVQSAGDEFFVPDSSQFYFDDLIGPTYQRYVPNTGHGLIDDATEDNEATNGIVNFYAALTDGATLPDFSWETSDHGTTISVSTADAPDSVRVWQATNPVNRDFRITTFGAQWTSSILTDQGGGEYSAEIPAPEVGATAFMVELSYNVGGHAIKFTTDISVVEYQAADFDQDFDVDAEDLAQWQSDFGLNGNSDADRDGDTDGYDLLVWQQQFDNGVPAVSSSTTVPEPTTGVMMLAGCSLAIALTRCNRAIAQHGR